MGRGKDQRYVGAEAGEHVPRRRLDRLPGRADAAFGARGRRGGGRKLRLQEKAPGGGLDAMHVPVAEPALGVAGVVSRQGDPEGGLALSGGTASRTIARPQNRGGRRQIPTGIEGLFDGQPEPVQIGAVDLGQAEIQVRALGQEVTGDPRGLDRGRGTANRRGSVIDADSQRIEAAFHIGNRGQGFRRRRRGAGLAEGDDDGEVEQGGAPMSL